MSGQELGENTCDKEKTAMVLKKKTPSHALHPARPVFAVNINELVKLVTSHWSSAPENW